MPPLVSIIALNYNNTAVTVEFLRSINEHCRYPAIEVIVVDNGSVEDPSAPCRAEFPAVKMVLTGENLGFSGGNNEGIKIATGDYIFIVNNDTEFTPGLLEELIRVFHDYADAGMVCPKFQYFFHKGTLEWAGFREVNVITGRNTAIGHGEKDEGQHNQIRETPYAHGGAMLVSRKALQDVGLMPAEFFLYYEELDWSEQFRRKGYKIYYQPTALIYHKESMTTGKASPLKTYYQTRNRILFMKRNVVWYQFLAFIIFYLFLTIPKNTLKFLVEGRTQHLKAFWKGTAWHIFPSIKF